MCVCDTHKMSLVQSGLESSGKMCHQMRIDRGNRQWTDKRRDGESETTKKLQTAESPSLLATHNKRRGIYSNNLSSMGSHLQLVSNGHRVSIWLGRVCAAGIKLTKRVNREPANIWHVTSDMGSFSHWCDHAGPLSLSLLVFRVSLLNVAKVAQCMLRLISRARCCHNFLVASITKVQCRRQIDRQTAAATTRKRTSIEVCEQQSKQHRRDIVATKCKFLSLD